MKDFPPNFYINCIQDEIGSRPYYGICEVCEKDWLMSQYRCVDCDLDVCKFCIHDHKLFKHLTSRQANIMKIETGNVGPNLTSDKFCADHKDQSLQMYCLTCDAAVCVTCVCENHRKHNTMTLHKKFQLAQKHLQFDLDKLQLDVKQVKSALTKLHDIEKSGDKSADDAILQIQEQAQANIHRIHKQADEKIDKIKEDRGKHLKDIHDYEKDLAVYLEQLQRGAGFLGDLQDEDMCIELLSSFQKYQGVLESTEKSVVNRKIKQNDFTFIPGKVVEKLGNVWMGKSVLKNHEQTNNLMPQDEPKKGVFKFLHGRVTCNGFLYFAVCLCLLVGVGQFVWAIGNDGATLETVACAVGYCYLCLAGVFAYRKAKLSAEES